MIWPDVLPVLPNDVAFVQQSSSYRSPVLKKGSTCRCQAVTTVRGPFSPQFPFSQRGQINEECLLRNFEKAWAWQTPQTLCQEDSLVADDVFWRLPGIQSLPGITFPVPVPGKNEPSIKQLLPCWKNKNLPSFKVLPVLPIEWAFVQQSSPQ